MQPTFKKCTFTCGEFECLINKLGKPRAYAKIKTALLDKRTIIDSTKLIKSGNRFFIVKI